MMVKTQQILTIDFYSRKKISIPQNNAFDAFAWGVAPYLSKRGATQHHFVIQNQHTSSLIW